MFFSRIGSWIAGLGFGLGTLFLIGTHAIKVRAISVVQSEVWAQTFLQRVDFGEIQSQSVWLIYISVRLGVLCEISRSLDSRRTTP